MVTERVWLRKDRGMNKGTGECHPYKRQVNAVLLGLNPYGKFRDSALEDVEAVKSMSPNGRMEGWQQKEREAVEKLITHKIINLLITVTPRKIGQREGKSSRSYGGMERGRVLCSITQNMFWVSFWLHGRILTRSNVSLWLTWRRAEEKRVSGSVEPHLKNK